MQNDPTVITVTQLNRQIRSWLEMEIGEIKVTGELSNFSKPTSGHFYFTLKDHSAQLRCVYFRNYHDKKNHAFQDGQQVIASGRLSLYEAKGEYQLIVHNLREAGLGELYHQFEQLKIKLQAQGLFEQARKKKIPRFPVVIGIITSTNGAALRDILTTLARRFPLAAIKIYTSEVQGKEASKQLIKALNKANEERLADVLILSRGGGSLEDLWAFNDEQLAFTISRSTIPVVSGIGHETDFTIADFVADLRAATPTAAAEAVTPNQLDLLSILLTLEERILRAIHHFSKHQKLRLLHHRAKLLSPAQLISRHWQALDYLEKQLQYNMYHLIQKKQAKLNHQLSQLNAKNPKLLFQQHQTKLQYFEQQLIQVMQIKFNKSKEVFTIKLATLHAVSPLATLDRGYALATFNKTILFNSHQVRPGDNIEVRLAKGNLQCTIITVKNSG
ncbi:exodeoxyribonuclease VII large subunit [Legionella fairfieldensis]|uniref:exodeoxyribonuclease VII large subunit n=1 Tax=Legionella fairfieldensis TaxID=45064 RepID=UPI000490D404|nr:exodeoxyribonuclease VII large subunit [Legionella fairfieldensis]